MNVLRAIRTRVRAMARMERKALDALDAHVRALYEGREKLRWSMQVPEDCPSAFLQGFPYRWEWGTPGMLTREAYEALPMCWEKTSSAPWLMFSSEGVQRDLSLEQALTICRYICQWNAPWEYQIAWDVPRAERVWWLLQPPSMYASIFVVSINPGAERQHVDWACLGYWQGRYGKEEFPLFEGWNAHAGRRDCSH